ncbi:MAG: BACON domain-containing protein [Bacteroidales bacterium]|nr:BACON domain-containing protein [Bacteroidales bacterium]
MKHFLKTIAMFCLGACTMASCGDEPTPTKQEEEAKLEVSKTELGFSQNADSKVVSVTTTGVWYVENNSDWISISPMGGKGNGAITVSVSQNASGQSRESYFSVAIDSDSKVIVVSQSATDTPEEENNGEETGGNDENGENGDNGNNGNETGDNNESGESGEEQGGIPAPVGVPELTETVVKEITDRAATVKSTINSSSGYLVIESGFCIGTTKNPTVENSVVKVSYEEPNLGTYSDRIVGLEANTTYYVRSYASNSKGVGYGTVAEFKTTVNNYATGAVQGYFSVSASSKVAFSQGNLQYQASTKTWRFAEHQYDMIGEVNKIISSSYSGYIDLFGWGTSGYNGSNPYMTSKYDFDYGDVGASYGGIASTNYDWGVYNKISNGGNQAGMWRTLTNSEWGYVLSKRTDASSLKGLATVNGVAGMILLPDNWITPDGITFNSGVNGFSNSTCSTS